MKRHWFESSFHFNANLHRLLAKAVCIVGFLHIYMCVCTLMFYPRKLPLTFAIQIYVLVCLQMSATPLASPAFLITYHYICHCLRIFPTAMLCTSYTLTAVSWDTHTSICMNVPIYSFDFCPANNYTHWLLALTFLQTNKMVLLLLLVFVIGKCWSQTNILTHESHIHTYVLTYVLKSTILA